MSKPLKSQYFRRFLAYALNYKWLLLLAIGMGVTKFVVNYTFPWVIGSAVDDVIAPKNAKVDRAVIEKLTRERPDMTLAELARQQAGEAAMTPPEKRIRWLWVLVALGLLFSLIHAVATFGRGYYNAKLGNRIIADLRQDLFDHLHRLSLHFYSRERTGSIVSRLITDIQQAGQLINGGVISVVMDLTSLIVGLVLLLSISWRLTAACMTIMPLYMLTFKMLNPHVKRASMQVQSQLSKISGNVQERLAGIALVKTYATENREREQFVIDTEEHYDRVVLQSTLSNWVSAISEGLVHLGQVVVIGLGGYYAVYGKLKPGEVITFMGWLAVMYTPVRRFADVNVIYQTSLAAIERVFGVFDVTPKIVEKANCVKQRPPQGRVRFEDVYFDYSDDSEESRGLEEKTEIRGQVSEVSTSALKKGNGSAKNSLLPDDRTPTLPSSGVPGEGKRWVLNGLSFDVEAGQRVALVGPSGSGKSTLVSLLPRLYDVSQGRILIDNVDLRDYQLRPLRRSIGIVQQDSFLLSGSVRDNIAYGRPKATDEDVMAAAKAANAHDFIMALPEGYHSMLGERGVNLSGGQRQRISIARAILKDPRILILDEATSALDSESEALVQEALGRLMEGRTCFIIAHRLSTVRHVDRILVLQGGKIVESGRHGELLEHNGLYARLVHQQFGMGVGGVPAKLEAVVAEMAV